MYARCYQRLSELYDLDWGRWPTPYLSLLHDLMQQHEMPNAYFLDLACGTGTMAIALVKEGHSVHGIDLCPEMISIAREKSKLLSRVSFEVANITSWNPTRSFDIATCTFDSINYLVGPGQLQAMLHTAAAALRPGGLLVFDSNTEQAYIKGHSGTKERKLGGEIFLQKLHYDADTKLATTVFEFLDGSLEVHRQRPFDKQELSSSLSQAGLTLLHTFSGFNRTAADEESERLFCVAERNGNH